MKRILAFLLCVIMVITSLPATTLAASDNTNIYWEYRAGATGTTVFDPSTALNPGDTFRIRLSCNKMTVASFACGFDFDADVFEVTKITDPTLRWHGTKVVIDEETEEEIEVTQDWDEGPTSVSSIAEANNDGHVGVVFAGTDDVTYEKKLICIITLKVKADAPNGGTDIVFFEDSDGADGFNSVAAGTNLSATLIIGSTEPAPPECDHTETKLVPNADGTHNVVCTNTECNHVVTKNVTCSGTDDGDHTTDVKCDCGNTVTAGTAHKDENPKDHKCDYGCGTDMGEHKSNAAYPCVDGTCEYCRKTVSATTAHKDADPKDHKCDYGCGTDMGEHKSNAAHPCLDGTCEHCGEPIRATTDHSYTPGTPVWSDNNTKCTVTGACACGATTTAVTTNIKTQVTTEADCQTPEGTTHTATFTEPWVVGNVTTGSTGNTNPDKHPEESISTKEETTSASCTEEGKVETVTFCTACEREISRTLKDTIPAGSDCVLRTPEYSWATNYSTCTAEVKCQKGTVHKTETVVDTSSKVTTVADCQNAEVVTYTADFTSDWAEDQTEDVIGDTNPNKHVGTATVSYRYNDDYTHTEVSAYACGHSVDGATTACADGDDADELCDTCGNNLHTHEWTLTEYKWEYPANPEDYSCTAYAKCECGETTSAEGTMRVEKTDDAWCYMPAGYRWTAVFDVAWAETQTLTGRHGTERDPDRHGITDNIVKVDENTHQAYCYFCQSYLGEPAPHDTNTVNFAGNCLVPARYTCSCGYEYTGTTNPDVHASSQIAYKYVNYEQHTAYHTCCDDPIEPVNHELGEDGSCVCGAIELSVYFAYADFEGNDDPIVDGGFRYFWVMPDQDLILDVYPTNGYGYVDYYIADLDDESDDAPYEAGIVDELKVSSDWYDAEWLYITVDGVSLQTIDLNGGSVVDPDDWGEDYDPEKNVIFHYGNEKSSWKLSWYTEESEEIVREGYKLSGFMRDGKFHDVDEWIYGKAGDETLTLVWECNHDEAFHEYSYTDNNDGTHTVKCECDETLETTESHDYTTGDADHTCACGKVEEFTLTVNVLATDEDVELTVPYGANLLEVLAQAVTDGKIPALDESIEVNIEDSMIGEATPFDYSYHVSEELGYAPIEENFTMPAGDFEIDQDYYFTGWDIYDGNYAYQVENIPLESGWHNIEEDFDGVDGGAWYYFYEGTGEWEGWYFRAEGLTRAPYPSDEINGITYAPDADAVASDPDFIDATEAWFMFGDDGKFQYNARGIVDNSKLVNGMLAWHPGLVKIPGSLFYHYFLGNEEIGGNIGADGDVWVTRIAEGLDREFVLGGIYTFEDSKLCDYTGITAVGGKLRFYGSEGADENRLMAGNGLTKVGENFIYVRSNGELVVNADYYVPTNNKGIVPGTYHFDENGFLVNPELTTKNGIVAENGGLFFYENGKIAYNKGLIQYNGGIIYVRSNGQLAVGEYYVTNLANFNGNDVKYGDKVTFGDDGYMVAAKNGIVDGMYYIDNQIAYNSGVVQLENGKYIYVKSNGTVVMNTNYWITNVGDTGVVAKNYYFDANGYFTPEFAADQKDGIVDGYYYVDGKIAYGAGLIYLEDEGCYIYVRSNGQLATGIYWPTATNGYDFSGRYDFGADGKLYI